LHQVVFNEQKSLTHASGGPDHFASSFFDSGSEIESDKRLVFDNQYRDLIQQRISPKGNAAPVFVRLSTITSLRTVKQWRGGYPGLPQANSGLLHCIEVLR
jgi:hypothetical protein